MAKKKVELTIIQRLDAESREHPIVDSEKGINNFMRQTDEQESTWGRLCRQAREAAEWTV